MYEGYIENPREAILSLLQDAIQKGASDIHFDPQNGFTLVRYRVNGNLYPVMEIEPIKYREIEYRLIYMAGLDPQRRDPQSGRIDVQIDGHTYSFRLESAFSFVQDGTKLALRFISKDISNIQVESLGFEKKDLLYIEGALAKSYGLILVSGPTGSGKTTTLYSFINRLNRPEVHILTAEDPAECPLEGINQLEVKESISFHDLIRSAMRLDPDIIMIGEIRDEISANTAIKAALSGHLVLSTIHANNALQILHKLQDFKIDIYNMIYSIRLLIAQRLVQTVCHDCAIPSEPSPILKIGMQKHNIDPPDTVLNPGPGCPKCQTNITRKIVYELFPLDEEDQAKLFKILKAHENPQTLFPFFKEKYKVNSLVENICELLAKKVISEKEALRYI